MRNLHSYVAAVCVSGLTSALFLDWATLGSLDPTHAWGFVALLGLGLLAESLTFTFPVGRGTGTSSILFVPLMATVILFGPAGAVLFIAVAGGVGETIIRKKPPLRATFNIGQYVLSAAIAGLLFSRLGGYALVLDLQEGALLSLGTQLIPFVIFGIAFLAINHAAVTLAIAINEEWPIRKVWALMTGPSGTNLFYDLLVSPIAILIAYLYAELWIVALLIVILPLLFIRYSYMSTHRLQQANRDLLTVLVKAIETRDPYTSGHSVRVADLSERVSRELGLPERTVQDIKSAALLHDIGKIDVAYEQILQKPSNLTDQERKLIESHVIKGVDLLASLSSVSDNIILYVRHHHEWVNGQGYPSGLRGEEIPIGARVIKTCDAVDAMLSDRPYRKALDLSEVRVQLEKFQGIQFDPAVVRAVSTAGILECHAATGRVSQTPNEGSQRGRRILIESGAESNGL